METKSLPPLLAEKIRNLAARTNLTEEQLLEDIVENGIYAVAQSLPKSENNSKFRLTFTVSCDLSYDLLWPDGDGPKNPTVHDVYSLIEADGGAQEIWDDWCIAAAGAEGLHIPHVRVTDVTNETKNRNR